MRLVSEDRVREREVWSESGVGYLGILRSLSCPMRKAASLANARLMVEWWLLIVGWNQVGVCRGLRHMRPCMLLQLTRQHPHPEGVWPSRDHWGLWVLKLPIRSVGVVSSKVWESKYWRLCPWLGTT